MSDTELSKWAAALERRLRYSELLWKGYKRKQTEERLERYVRSIRMCDQARDKIIELTK